MPRLTKYNNRTKYQKRQFHDTFMIDMCNCHDNDSSNNNDSISTCDDMKLVGSEIKNLECKISKQINCHKVCSDDDRHKSISRSSKIRIVIDNLSLCNCFNAEVKDNYVVIFGTYVSNCIKVCDLSGSIKIDDIATFNINNVFGNIILYNSDNGTIYNGLVCIVGNCLEYTLSNKPLIPIGTSFSGTISLIIHLSR